MVKFRSATLPKGNYVKLRPQAKSFLDKGNKGGDTERGFNLYPNNFDPQNQRTNTFEP